MWFCLTILGVMKELLRTNDITVIAYARAVLDDDELTVQHAIPASQFPHLDVSDASP